MLTLGDVEAIEGGAESEEEYFASLQRAINSLDAWKFQGSYGRAMMDAITDGRCLLGREHTADYWGNLIPSRDMVKTGTKGSLAYVREQYGDDWAVYIEAIE